MKELTDEHLSFIDQFQVVFIKRIDLNQNIGFLKNNTSFFNGNPYITIIRIFIGRIRARTFFEDDLKTFVNELCSYFWSDGNPFSPLLVSFKMPIFMCGPVYQSDRAEPNPPSK